MTLPEPTPPPARRPWRIAAMVLGGLALVPVVVLALHTVAHPPTPLMLWRTEWQ